MELLDRSGHSLLIDSGDNMYRQIPLITLIIFCIGYLHAQEGLYGLVYGDSRDTASGKLVRQGFQVDDSLSTRLLMRPAGEDLIKGIELRFAVDSDSLAGWSIGYGFYEDEDMGELVGGAFISRHGPGFIKRDDGIYLWNMENNCLVTAGWDHFQQLFVVDYRQVR